jgi:hypothetical protein
MILCGKRLVKNLGRMLTSKPVPRAGDSRMTRKVNLSIAESSMSILKVDGLAKTYKDVQALAYINFEFGKRIKKGRGPPPLSLFLWKTLGAVRRPLAIRARAIVISGLSIP